jgi:hypothetical protein
MPRLINYSTPFTFVCKVYNAFEVVINNTSLFLPPKHTLVVDGGGTVILLNSLPDGL